MLSLHRLNHFPSLFPSRHFCHITVIEYPIVNDTVITLVIALCFHLFYNRPPAAYRSLVIFTHATAF